MSLSLNIIPFIILLLIIIYEDGLEKELLARYANSIHVTKSNPLPRAAGSM